MQPFFGDLHLAATSAAALVSAYFTVSGMN